MNYRHKLLNQLAKNQLSQLQQDIINLQNSTDLKLLEQAQQESKRLQKILDDTVNLLGSSDIKNLSDLSNLLQGKTLKELVQEKNLLTQKIQDQDTALLNLARQKLTGKKEALKLLNELETNWSKKEIDWETEKEKHTQALAQSKEKLTNLEKEKSELSQQIKTLTEANDKFQREKETLILSKNQAVEQIKQNHQEQLRKLNVLFDINAVEYETIDFNGLYNLLGEVSKRERERESKSKNWWQK